MIVSIDIEFSHLFPLTCSWPSSCSKSDDVIPNEPIDFVPTSCKARMHTRPYFHLDRYPSNLNFIIEFN